MMVKWEFVRYRKMENNIADFARDKTTNYKYRKEKKLRTLAKICETTQRNLKSISTRTSFYCICTKLNLHFNE